MAPATSVPSDEAQVVVTLRAEQEVEGVFACTRKERRISRAGTPYLTVELADRTGTIRARAFRDADVLAGHFERGEVVRVRGRVERYREQLQIMLASIARAPHEQAAVERFLPVAYRDIDELEGFFEHLVREVYDPGLAGLLARMLADQRLRAELRRAPCSLPTSTARAQGAASAAARAGHHAYLGGLLEHSVAVAAMALELCSLHPRLDRDLLLCAALVHDVGKTREFSYGAEIELSAEGRLLGHLQLGLRVLAAHAPADLDEERRLALEHCLLTHHGADAAAGQRFACAEALALYRLNALDAHLKSAFEHGFPRPRT